MFSVVIPLYNKAPYIQRALDSVFAQSCPVDEIIVVNDGSTDGGEQIAKGQRGPSVRVIDQANQGVSVARNVGIEAATQPYIAFLDADDEWLPDYLARVKAMIGQMPGAGVYGTGFVSVAGGRELGRYGVRDREVLRSKKANPVCRKGDKRPRDGGGDNRPAFGPVDYFKVWQRGPVLHTSSMVVPRAVAQAVGGFPVGVAICEDYEFLVKVALGHPVILASDALVRYDVAVPGQAVEYWKGLNRKGFSVLPYHRFLVKRLMEVSRGERSKEAVDESAREEAQAQKEEGFGDRRSTRFPSFAAYCRKEFQKCLLQRLYWSDFAALGEFYRELGLEALDLGVLARICGWIANHPTCQPGVASAMRIIRWLRVNAASAAGCRQ
jgi:glycosyltransferase involved in cell wall biosynthesis